MARVVMHRPRVRWFLLLSLTAAAVATSSVEAAHIDRVVVGEPGRNSTEGFSPALVVEVMPESGYVSQGFDGDHANWVGPPYHSTANSKLGGRASTSWSVYFDRGLSLGAAIKRHLIHGWAPFLGAAIAVPHVVGSTKVAAIKGKWLLTKAPEDLTAQFEGVLSFPLCHGVVASVEFDFLEPFSDDAGSGAEYRVYTTTGDKGATVWNKAAAELAPAHVALGGYLPAARVTARANGRHILGTVTDCSGAPMPGARVATGAVTRTADATGHYVLPVTGPGKYVVTATAGGGTARSTTVNVG
jgi:hypothetical protein